MIVLSSTAGIHFFFFFSLFFFFFFVLLCFFFNDTATTEIYTLSPTRRSSDLLYRDCLIPTSVASSQQLTTQAINAASSTTTINLTTVEKGNRTKTWRHEGERFATMDHALRSSCRRSTGTTERALMSVARMSGLTSATTELVQIARALIDLTAVPVTF